MGRLRQRASPGNSAGRPTTGLKSLLCQQRQRGQVGRNLADARRARGSLAAHARDAGPAGPLRHATICWHMVPVGAGATVLTGLAEDAPLGMGAAVVVAAVPQPAAVSPAASPSVARAIMRFVRVCLLHGLTGFLETGLGRSPQCLPPIGRHHGQRSVLLQADLGDGVVSLACGEAASFGGGELLVQASLAEPLAVTHVVLG
jgi:hypothetical protein